jgi:hypothetical protein
MIKCICAHCHKLNENIEGPKAGMSVPFFAQNEEETKSQPGAYNIKHKCYFCGKTFCIVWDMDPRNGEEKKAVPPVKEKKSFFSIITGLFTGKK